jgi:hypothetical protein
MTVRFAPGVAGAVPVMRGGLVYTWEGGTYSGVTDDQIRAFREAERHATAEGATVILVQLETGFRTMSAYYAPLIVWRGIMRNGKVKWSGSTARNDTGPLLPAAARAGAPAVRHGAQQVRLPPRLRPGGVPRGDAPGVGDPVAVPGLADPHGHDDAS